MGVTDWFDEGVCRSCRASSVMVWNTPPGENARPPFVEKGDTWVQLMCAYYHRAIAYPEQLQVCERHETQAEYEARLEERNRKR